MIYFASALVVAALTAGIAIEPTPQWVPGAYYTFQGFWLGLIVERYIVNDGIRSK